MCRAHSCHHLPMLKTTSPFLSNRSKLGSLLRVSLKISTMPSGEQPLISQPQRSSTSNMCTSSISNKDHIAAAAVTEPKLASLENLNFSPTFITELPSDTSDQGNIPRQVFGALFSYVNPTPTGTEPSTIIASAEVARLIGLDPSEFERPEFAMIFSGNANFPDPAPKPYAQCYGGHQFGNWAGQLGDGRAICLGEVLNPNSNERWELQLKGAGKTPYSRFADGRAVLRSSLREYVASEAMFALGVPTTRALSLVRTGADVMRDMFYNGNAQMEPGAVVCRVARSFIRFGTFQLPVSRGDDQVELTKQVCDYVIKYFYPECAQAKNPYASMLQAVARRTGHLMSEWHRVGFVHGVGNTDNFSILGDTIDYGPYGWLERFDPDFTPNTTDLPGRRYCFHSQPEIGQWNILQLARALALGGLMTEDEAREGVVAYGDSLTESFTGMMANKFGLKEYDRVIANGLFKEMYEDSADYTNTMRALSSISMDGQDGSIPPELAAAIGLDELSPERVDAWKSWILQYNTALKAAGWASDEERIRVQNATNPAIVPRNHVLVSIIGEAEAGNYAPLEKYMQALKTPYSLNAGLVDPAWLLPGPKQSRLGVELLSCSS